MIDIKELTCYNNQNRELYHYGVKGMKWGVRRYQNEDGSLTSAGRKHYKNVEHPKRNNRRSKYLAKRSLTYEKSKKALNLSNHKKSSRFLKLEQKYKSKGMNDEEAAVYAYRREKAEKYVAAAAGISAAAICAFAAYKHYDKTVDKFIKADTVLKRVTLNGDKTLNDTFYASRKNKDANRYVGLRGEQLKENSGGKNVFQKNIKVTNTIKVASDKKARKALYKYFSNNIDDMIEFDTQLRQLRDRMTSERKVLNKQFWTINKAIDSLNKSKVDDAVYKAFNLTLSGNTSDIATNFYNQLRKSGYDAIRDINDRELSGYKTKSAIIVFNKAKTFVEGVRIIPSNEISQRHNVEVKKLIANVYGKLSVGALTTIGGITSATHTISKIKTEKNNDRIVAEYRKEHPNTQLSYNDILNLNFTGKKS